MYLFNTMDSNKRETGKRHEICKEKSFTIPAEGAVLVPALTHFLNHLPVAGSGKYNPFKYELQK